MSDEREAIEQAEQALREGMPAEIDYDEAARLLEQGYAEGWRPEPGDVISGKVLAVDFRPNQHSGDDYPIVTLQTKDGTQRAVHGFHYVLSNELLRQAPQIGDTIAVAFDGMSESGEYAVYRVRVFKPEGTKVEWDRIKEKRK